MCPMSACLCTLSPVFTQLELSERLFSSLLLDVKHNTNYIDVCMWGTRRPFPGMASNQHQSMRCIPCNVISEEDLH